MGFSPLMTAAAYNAQESLDCLLEFEPELDLQNPSGKTALMLACQSGTKNIDAVFIGRTHFCTKTLGICYFFGPETFIHFVAQETSIISKVLSLNFSSKKVEIGDQSSIITNI